MIGGNDIVIPAIGDAAALDACVRMVQLHWPQARFEDALTGDKYPGYPDIPLGSIQELFVYPNAQAEAAWDADSPDSPPNSMLYLIRSPKFVTAVLDDPNTADMRSILDSIRKILGWMNNTYAEAA